MEKKPITNSEIQNFLISLMDIKSATFQQMYLPNLPNGSILGIKTPPLRTFAKKLVKNYDFEPFISVLPHKYFEENQLHAFILSEIKDFNYCLIKLEEFLPYIDNWGTCDQLSPKCFKKNKEQLLPYINKWIDSKEEYIIRFGMGMLMRYFLDEDFNIKYVEKVISIKREEYYIRMMQAWYMATALAKQYDDVIFVLQQQKLDKWTHNKTIQKACESFRISNEKKQYLRTLKIK